MDLITQGLIRIAAIGVGKLIDNAGSGKIDQTYLSRQPTPAELERLIISPLTVYDTAGDIMWASDASGIPELQKIKRKRESAVGRFFNGRYDEYVEGREIQAWDWEHANLAIQRLNEIHYAGYSNWRLPTKNELIRLYHYARAYGWISYCDEYAYMFKELNNSSGIKNIASFYWTCEVDEYLHFGTEKISYSSTSHGEYTNDRGGTYGGSIAIWPVRDIVTGPVDAKDAAINAPGNEESVVHAIKNKVSEENRVAAWFVGSMIMIPATIIGGLVFGGILITILWNIILKL